MGWYKQWFGTPYYALLYGHRDELDAHAWVEAIIGKWELAPGSRVLDMACGRGRHAKWFHEGGMNVTGIDISAEAIREGIMANPGVELLVHDMREPLAIGQFDAACCLFTSLGYFDSLEDDQKVFDAAFTALRPGGRFVVDFMNSAMVLADLIPQEHVDRQGVKFDITRTLHEGAIIKNITVHEAGRTEVFEEKVQALMPDQLEKMALNAGFIVEDRTDGPEISTFDPIYSKRFVLWLKRPVT
jgi:SAM-dependent methyltransferase